MFFAECRHFLDSCEDAGGLDLFPMLINQMLDPREVRPVLREIVYFVDVAVLQKHLKLLLEIQEACHRLINAPEAHQGDQPVFGEKQFVGAMDEYETAPEVCRRA